MTWTPEVIGAVAAAVAVVITALTAKPTMEAVMKFADWWRLGRERRLAQRALDEELNEKGHKYIIRRQDSRITALEKHLSESIDEHAQCREALAALRTQCESQKGDIERLTRRINYLETERNGGQQK